jgi:hypothetical protein
MTWINRTGAALAIEYPFTISAILRTAQMITFPYVVTLCLKNMTQGEKQCHAALSRPTAAYRASNISKASMVWNFAALQTVREITYPVTFHACPIVIKKTKNHYLSST